MIGIYRDDHLPLDFGHPLHLWPATFFHFSDRKMCVDIPKGGGKSKTSCSNPKGWHGIIIFIQHFLVHGFGMFRLLWVELLVTRLLIPFCWNNAWDDAAVATSWESRASATKEGFDNTQLNVRAATRILMGHASKQKYSWMVQLLRVRPMRSLACSIRSLAATRELVLVYRGRIVCVFSVVRQP